MFGVTQHKSAIRNLFYNSIIFLIASTFSLFICDWALGLFNFPSELLQRISHPKNFEEIRSNVEFRYVFKTNDHGLRYRNIPKERVGASHRIFVSGDSFTEGEGIDEGKRFTDLLEDELSSSSESVLFINGGLAGTGPLEYGRLFQNVGLEYNPEGLLICLFVNDVADTPAELVQSGFIEPYQFRSDIKKGAYSLWPHIYTLLREVEFRRQYRNKTRTTDFISTVSQQAEKQNIPGARIIAWIASLPQDLVKAVNRGEFNGAILSLGLLYPRIWSDSIDLSSNLAMKKWQNMTLILSKILERAEQSAVETGIVLLPAPFMYDPRKHSEKNLWIIAGTEIHERWLWEDTEIQKRLRIWTKDKDVPYLDLTPMFRQSIQSNKNPDWELDGHWNNLGHQLVAKAIASWLVDQHVFSFIKNKRVTNR